MNKRTKALQFDVKTRKRILDRDHGCIFCQIGFYMHSSSDFQYKQLDIMHIVNRSQGGLGIEQNGVTGCRYHHQLLDNGAKRFTARYAGIYRKIHEPNASRMGS